MRCFSSMVKTKGVKDKNKYWENLIAGFHEEGEKNGPEVSEYRDYKADSQWIVRLKKQLKKVFLWDLFDKKEAKLRLSYRLHTFNKVHNFYNKVWLRAAVIVIALISGAIGHSLFYQTNHPVLYSEITVPLGQMTRIKLPDGSKVWINSGSVFKYPAEFDKSSRDIYLDGEAFMEIAKNPQKPFIVNTANFSVKVLGTSFNVDAYSDDKHASVTLVEGSVFLQSNKKEWSKNMIPGQIALINEGKNPSISEVRTEFYTAWKEGKIVFRKETLEEISKKLERWYNVEICFADEELKNLKFSGTFLKYKPIEQVFRSFGIMDHRIDFVMEDKADQKSVIKIMKRNKTMKIGTTGMN